MPSTNPVASPTAPILPPSLADLLPQTIVAEADGTHLAAYSAHYGIRLKSSHEPGSWRRSREEDAPWTSPGPNCKHLWPDMTGKPNVHISEDLYRALVYAVGAAEGCTRVVNRHTPSKDRDHSVNGLASLEIYGERSRIVVMSGREYDRKNRLGKDPKGVVFSLPVQITAAELGAPVWVSCEYLINIMDHLGRDLDLWVGEPLDPVGIHGLYGEAVLMPLRL